LERPNCDAPGGDRSAPGVSKDVSSSRRNGPLFSARNHLILEENILEIRSYKGTDENDLLEVWRTSMKHDPVSRELFRTKVLLDPNFDAGSLPVAVVDGRVVGFVLALTRQVPYFMQGLEPAYAWITAFGVHPNFQRRGIATELFEYIFDRLRASGCALLEISPYIPNYFVPGVDVQAYPNTIAFLENRVGFRTIERVISMGVDLTDFEAPLELIKYSEKVPRDEQVTVEPVTAADLPEVMPFLAKEFGWGWYGHALGYLEDYFGGRAGRMVFLVARYHGEVVGFCQQREERFGPFGVREDSRGKGIGRLLLFRCLEMMKAQHVFYAYFLWTDEAAARLYTRAGFRRRREFSILRRDL
jgi:mycothiol synthase